MDRRQWIVMLWTAALVGCGNGAEGARDAASDLPATMDAPGLDAQPDDAGVVQLRVLAINDLHGALRPTSSGALPDGGMQTIGGVAFLASYVREQRAEARNSLFVSAGDLVGASPLVSGLFHDEPAIEAMNAMGLDYNGVGNHEFDEGLAELRRLQTGGCHPTDGCRGTMPFPGATFRFLAANVSEGPRSTTIFPRYDIREYQGVRVAVVGMTLQGTPRVVSASGVAGLSFAGEAATVNALVPELRAMGVGVIVVLLHEGGSVTPESSPLDGCLGLAGPIVEIAQMLDDAIDVIASAHTHQTYICRLSHKLVTSAGAQGRYLTVMDLDLSVATGRVISSRARNVPILGDRAPDPAVAALVARFESLSEPLEARPFGTITDSLTRVPSTGGQSTLGSVVTDAQLAATRDAGAVVAFQNNGGLRADLLFARSGGETADGQVTYGEAFSVHPFGNVLRTATFTGAQIEAFLESLVRSGAPSSQVSRSFTYTWDAVMPAGARVDPASIRIDGRPIDLASRYRVTFNDIMPSGYPILDEGTELTIGPVDLDALEAYFRASPPVSPPPLDRVTRLN